MWDKIVSFIYALIINVILLIILIYSLNWVNTSKSKSTSTTDEVLIDENAVDAEIKRLKQEQQAEQQKSEYDQIITESYLQQLSEQEQKTKQEIEALKQRRLIEMEALKKLRQETELAKDN